VSAAARSVSASRSVPRMMSLSSRSNASGSSRPRRTARMYVSWWTTSANGSSRPSTSRAWQFKVSPGGWVLNSPRLTVGHTSDIFALLSDTRALPVVHLSYPSVASDRKPPFGCRDTPTGRARDGHGPFIKLTGT
jgi:hypothetical protein